MALFTLFTAMREPSGLHATREAMPIALKTRRDLRTAPVWASARCAMPVRLSIQNTFWAGGSKAIDSVPHSQARVRSRRKATVAPVVVSRISIRLDDPSEAVTETARRAPSFDQSAART